MEAFTKVTSIWMIYLRRLIFSLFLGLSSLLMLTLVLPNAHAVEVGVVVDSSISMRRSDREQYAILAIKILADILDPNQDDLFITFFNRRYSSALDTSKHIFIRWSDLKVTGRPGDFTSKLHSELTKHSKYDAKCTYFAPSLHAALKEFKTSGPKLLIYLTDGESNDLQRDRGCVHSNGDYERKRFDGEINTLLSQTKVKVAPLLLSRGLSRKLRSELLSSYFLTFFDSQGRGGEPLQEVTTAEDLPYKFAELLTKTTPREVKLIGALKSRPRRTKKWQNLKNPGFDVDPALRKVDIVSVSSGGFFSNPLAFKRTMDVHLMQPSGSPPAWTPKIGELALGRHESLYRRGKSGQSSYIVMRATGASQGTPPLPGHWSVFRERSSSLRPHSFIVKYYDFKLELDTQSKRTSIPLEQPLCLRACLTTRNATGQSFSVTPSITTITPSGFSPPYTGCRNPLPRSLIKKIEVSVTSHFTEKGSNTPKPLSNLTRLLDDGTVNEDLLAYDSAANGCLRLTANDLGLNTDQLREEGKLGDLKIQASLIYNGEERAKSKELSVEVFPPIILKPDGVGVVEFLGYDNQGVRIGEQSCELFKFSEDNSVIPKLKAGAKPIKYEVRVKNLGFDPIYERMRISICAPEVEDTEEPICKDEVDPTKSKQSFPSTPAVIWSLKEAINKATISLELGKQYLICTKTGFRYKEMPDPTNFGAPPITLAFQPDHKRYKDRFPKKPKPTTREFEYGIGPKWKIHGDVELKVRLAPPGFLDRWWSILIITFFMLACLIYLWSGKKAFKLSGKLRYQIWEGYAIEPDESIAMPHRVPKTSSFYIKQVGITIETSSTLDPEIGEGIKVKSDTGVLIYKRNQEGNFMIMTPVNDRFGYWLGTDIIYQVKKQNQEGPINLLFKHSN